MTVTASATGSGKNASVTKCILVSSTTVTVTIGDQSRLSPVLLRLSDELEHTSSRIERPIMINFKLPAFCSTGDVTGSSKKSTY